MLKHSLLSDRLFHVAAFDGESVCLSMPQLMARLSAGEDLDFTALRPHQRAPWHAFLVQLAYLALDEDDRPVLPATAEEWVQRLRDLTPGYGDDTPWVLLNDNWQAPAFLQAPCGVGREADFKRFADTAQEIDVLVTARNHDEKTGKLPLREDHLDVLVYALVSLQGWAPFLGVGNYNTMRMNGGFSSRPQFRLAYERGAGAEFRRDFLALVETRDELEASAAALQIGTGRQSPHKLLWLAPWDSGSLPLADVHPLCLEVCRRVRVSEEHGRLRLRRASSDAMRVAAKDRRGVVLDPWAPIILGEQSKALTAQAHSLGYRSLQALLFDRSRTQLPTLAKPTPTECLINRPGTLIAQVLVSSDGATDGLLCRELPVSAGAIAQLGTAQALLAERSQEYVNLAGEISGKAYRSALLQFVDGSSDVDWKNRDFVKAISPWMDRFEQTVDEGFFEELFASVDRGLDDVEAQLVWAQWLARAAHLALAEATEALPTRNGLRLFARARAERLLRASLSKHNGDLLARQPMQAGHSDEERIHV